MAATATPLANGFANGFAHPADPNGTTGPQISIHGRKNSPETGHGRPRTQKKTQEESLLGSLCNSICDHQIGISVNLILLLLLTHNFLPRARRYSSKFLHLSYYNSDIGLYGCGTDDLFFVALWVVVFTGLRVFVMEYLLDPLARLGGIHSRKGLVRFKEQAWLVVYCTGSWSLGMYLMYNSEFWFNLRGLWEGWPFREISGLCKWYYLVQWGFWIQQIVVVNIEEKRKDYAQMFTHHIFTCSLLFLSYGYYHTRVGTIILCIMDIVDIVLPTAKLLKYLRYTTACDFMFGVFIVTWIVTRHVFFPMVLWSIYAHTPTAMPPGCYFADGTMVPSSAIQQYDALGGNEIWGNILRAYTDRTGPICWNPTIRYSFLGLLLALQLIIILWFVMIARIAINVLSGNAADDARSDDEGDDSEVEVDEENPRTTHSVSATKTSLDSAPLEQEVGVEGLTFARKGSPGVRGYRRSSNRNSGGRASGISIPGHGDRKELLGRIGCDKPT
ncbi:longevity assurance proteins LAG1/LAC1 [Lojkania enalia]|uniref:Longevity assurance proteins LAG1/LAC1 n=1 Tax=Lojkania enalia TaxID=147567 RepID=A0A9P4N250_9PLEO|nr:longevity assurance proteins LAG1/LAC1 [Didymosphaeria enalia]